MEPSQEIARLKQRVVGLWDVELTRTMPDGEKVSGKGILLATETALGHAIRAEFGLTLPGEDYEEAEFWWFDHRDNQVHLFCVTSREEARDQRGFWKDANTLALEWKGVMKGTEYAILNTFTWVSPNEIHVLRVDSIGTKKGPISVFNLRRQTEMTLV